MTRLFRSKSCGLVGLGDLNPIHHPPPSPFYQNDVEEEEEEEEDMDEDDDDDDDEDSGNPLATPFISPAARFEQRGRNGSDSNNGKNCGGGSSGGGYQLGIVDILVAALRKSLVTCSAEREEISSSMDISWPTEVRHVSHVTFDRFNGFLGLPTELEPELPRKVPSASANVFGVSAKSMQCSYDDRGNSVPTILLMMQRRLYVEGGLKAEGIFRINAENGQEEYVRDQLNKGVVPRGIDVHCLAGLIKAWFRELPSGVLDSLTPEQVMHCNKEDDCTQLVKLLPPTEAALLDWAINLMADVAEHEQYNKMNARNIAMVFAPNMTQMADPLTALIHAVQVMNLLKTLILKTLRERAESSAKARSLSQCSDPPNDNAEPSKENLNCKESFQMSADACLRETPTTGKFLRSSTMNRLESNTEDKFWSFEKKSDGEDEFESISGSSPPLCETGALGSECKSGYDDNRDWLNLRRGVRRLCRHPVFQLGKPAKKTKTLGIVSSRGGGETWA